MFTFYYSTLSSPTASFWKFLPHYIFAALIERLGKHLRRFCSVNFLGLLPHVLYFFVLRSAFCQNFTWSIKSLLLLKNLTIKCYQYYYQNFNWGISSEIMSKWWYQTWNMGDFMIGSAPPHDPIDIFVANPSFFPGLPQNLCHVRLAGGHYALTLLHVRMLFLINGAWLIRI